MSTANKVSIAISILSIILSLIAWHNMGVL